MKPWKKDSNQESKTLISEEECKCTRIAGHLEDVKWLLHERHYKPSAGDMALGDWVEDPHIWLHYVESCDGLLPDDDVLMSTNTRYWSIHDVQRYYLGDMHCEKVLFTYQYPNLRMPTPLGSYFWKANTALKLPPALYQRTLHSSIETTLKKLEMEEAQMDRLIVNDQIFKLDRLDYFKRKTFFRILNNLLRVQDRLELVSFENLCSERLEGVRLIQQLACFNAETLKYLFLWRFVQPNQNPILINYSYITESRFHDNHKHKSILHNMTTDEEKSHISKLLQELEVPEVKLTERCSDLIKDFHQKFDEEVEKEEEELANNEAKEVYENPYRPNKELLEENERKLRQLLSECKRAKTKCSESIILSGADPKRPWRTNTNKEKLLRIDNEIKQHKEKASQLISPLGDEEMQLLVKECRQDTLDAPPISADRLRQTVEAARKNLTNFQYRKVENSTATAILPEAHGAEKAEAKTPTRTSHGELLARQSKRHKSGPRAELQSLWTSSSVISLIPQSPSPKLLSRLPDITGYYGSGQYIPRPPSRHCFLRNIAALRNLRLLALEYSQLADGTGIALITILPILKRPHFRLQLMCREDQIPGRADAALGVGGYGIPDTSWKRVSIACPDIYLQMAFYRIRDYDNIRRFLTPSIPLRETHLQLGIDLKMRQRQDSDISCFVRHIAYFYSSTLVTLSIHQWRFAVFPLRRVFVLMPRLVRFHYIGRVEDDVDLKSMLTIVSCGACDKLKHIKIQIQDETAKRDFWKRAVASLNSEFADVMKLYDINLSMSVYKN